MGRYEFNCPINDSELDKLSPYNLFIIKKIWNRYYRKLMKAPLGYPPSPMYNQINKEAHACTKKIFELNNV